MTNRSLWSRIRRVWVTLGSTVGVVFAVWSFIAYRANDEARAAMQGNDRVSIAEADGVVRFLPVEPPPSPDTRVAFVFFPGSLVEPAAYAPLMRAVAESGTPAYMVTLPNRGAFGGAKSPELRARLTRLLGDPATPRRWIAGGHSLGGVVTSQVAADGLGGLAGIYLVGTSHPRDVDLSALTIPVTKVAGTLDGLASRREVEENARLLPPQTRWIWVDGGNHSQFGWYGFQPGDRFAKVASSVQHKAMIEAAVALAAEVRGTR